MSFFFFAVMLISHYRVVLQPTVNPKYEIPTNSSGKIRRHACIGSRKIHPDRCKRQFCRDSVVPARKGNFMPEAPRDYSTLLHRQTFDRLLTRGIHPFLLLVRSITIKV